jgi:hypothetical protein
MFNKEPLHEESEQKRAARDWKKVQRKEAEINSGSSQNTDSRVFINFVLLLFIY